MSATIRPSGLPLFMCARSRSPALRRARRERAGLRQPSLPLPLPEGRRCAAAPLRPATTPIPPEVHHTKLLHEPRALRALARPGAAQHKDHLVPSGVVGRLWRRHLGRRARRRCRLWGGGCGLRTHRALLLLRARSVVPTRPAGHAQQRRWRSSPNRRRRLVGAAAHLGVGCRGGGAARAGGLGHGHQAGCCEPE